MVNNKKKKRFWFTLVEILFVSTIMIILIPQVYDFLLSLKQYSNLNYLKSKTISEVAFVNTRLSNIIKNAYGINYGELTTTWDLDTLVLYTDKLETDKIQIYIERDLSKDISRLMIKYNLNNPKPLHSTRLFVEKFNVVTSDNPASDSQYLEIQPFVSVDLEARTRSLLEIQDHEEYDTLYNKSSTAIHGSWVLRNYTPSSLKN